MLILQMEIQENLHRDRQVQHYTRKSLKCKFLKPVHSAFLYTSPSFSVCLTVPGSTVPLACSNQMPFHYHIFAPPISLILLSLNACMSKLTALPVCCSISFLLVLLGFPPTCWFFMSCSTLRQRP